jgi:hypothetical protein
LSLLYGEWPTWRLVYVRMQLFGFLSKSCLDFLQIRFSVDL